MSNFAELSSGGGDAKFFVRWRGKREGPYPASVIEAKLAANEIGLLHEIFYNDRWVTIRDYITERESAFRTALQAREEQDRREREEAERQAKEQEEQQRAAALAEERRKAAQLESTQLQQSFEQRVPVSPLPSADHGSLGLRILGILLLTGGLAVVAYFFLAFDTSVESEIGPINNLGLMADRQNGIIVGIGLSIIGTIMFVIGSRNKH